MALLTAYITGTASVANGSKDVTGSGTAWADVGVTSGDVFWNVDGTASQRIDTVTDNTHLTLVNNWGGDTLLNADYEVRITPPSASVAATVRALLELLSNGVLSGIADSGSLSSALSQNNADTTIAPTGTGKVVINGAAKGSIDNSDIGQTTPQKMKATTIWQSARNAFFSSTQLVQSLTSSTEAMLGYGATWVLTPAFSGRVRIRIVGYVFNGTSGHTSQFRARYGTGSAPANGAASTGSSIGSVFQATSASTSASVPFCYETEVSGLTVSTAYWFDLGAFDNSGGAMTFRVQFALIEEF